ncbi:aldo/keto reductase [Maribellus sp. CM-23]|uniref:aldo/keto reductase n=1 Tax=Maribellus sp. CM-23 TaxID=2781026 RepID=UPI001F39C2F6|nr:aldo/keto reductase [Maribellus sp. CM-23]MCE4567093.1 aldo/keto reductase [Maribellus sp. CM-23]
MNLSSTTTLNNGLKMPWLGLGVFLSKEGTEVENAVKVALANGYKSIDTAAIYKNERGVGKAIRESGIPREDIFLTSKVWNADQGYSTTMAAFEESLEKLQTDYLDLYLIHWPKGERSKETWKAMEELYQKGRMKAIGVSNFLVHHLDDFLPHCKVMPAVNQVEFHPELIQPDLLAYCQKKGIQLEAWSPIMKGRVNDVPLMQELAAKYGKTPVQIVLRWDIQKGVVTIPKSVTPERIIANAAIFGFELSPEDMDKIDALDQNKRIGGHPDHITF